MTTAFSRLLSCALMAGALVLGTVPAAAASGGWSATLATALPAPRHKIIGGALWKCAGKRCSAPVQDSRPSLACRKVAKKLGPVARFTSPEGELAADALAKCNSG